MAAVLSAAAVAGCGSSSPARTGAPAGATTGARTAAASTSGPGASTGSAPGASTASGSGGSTRSSAAPGGPAAANQITRAAEISGAAKGFRIAMTLTESFGAVSITGTGTGAFDTARPSGVLHLRMRLPARAGSARTLEMTEIISGRIVYMRLPAALSARLPGGRPWLEIDLSRLAPLGGMAGLSSLGGGGSTDPGRFLRYLEAASGSGIRNLGAATVDGIATTHLRGRIDLNQALTQVPAAQRAAARQAIAALARQTGLRQIPVEVWVDGDHLVRRVAMAFDLHVAGRRVVTSQRIDFTAYGPQSVPPPPPPGQVRNMTGMMPGAASGASG